MRRGLLVIALFGLWALSGPGAGGQTGTLLRGKVTYVSGDVYYVSLGSPSGVTDSAVVSVVDGADTVATLKVFAVSSKSSACRLVSSTRAPKPGDVVVIRRDSAPAAEPATPGAAAGAAVPMAPVDTVPAPSRPEPPSVPAFSVRGRVTAGYQTYITEPTSGSTTQPSLSLNLRGDAPGARIHFEAAGTLRNTTTGTPGAFQAGSVNHSRVYRLFVEYDDSLNRIGFGRLFPFTGLPSGSIDGLVAARRFGVFEVGAAAGFDPDFREEHLVFDRKKVMAFAGARSAGPFGWSFVAAYAKTFLESATERSVASAAATLAPSRMFFFSAQSEVDFLFVRNSEVVHKPRLSSLLAMLSYRASDLITLGAGVTAWRSVYRLSLDTFLPDSLKDDQLRASPTFSLRLYAGGGFSAQEQYSPRNTAEGFGTEYSNLFSLGYDNVLESGVALRLTQNLNRSSIAVSTGYGVTARRSFAGSVDAGLRYQYNRYDFDQGPQDERTNVVGADLGVSLPGSLYLMLSAELTSGDLSDYEFFSGSLSWRF